jgi:hypothetical protein
LARWCLQGSFASPPPASEHHSELLHLVHVEILHDAVHTHLSCGFRHFLRDVCLCNPCLRILLVSMVHKILVHGLNVNDVQVIACAKALRFRRRLFFTTLSDICGAALRLHPCSSANADCNSDTVTKFASGPHLCCNASTRSQ